MKIAIMGVDGAGKSSAIKAFDSLEYTTLYMGYNTTIRKYSFLPSLEKFISKRGVMLFFFRVINDMLKIKKHRDYTDVVYDRYPYDILLYSNKGVIYKIKKLIINAFISKPDLIFFLHGDPLAINQRKNELSEKQIESMQNKYLQILEEFDLNYVGIDTVKQSIGEVENTIKRALELD
jgi:thymidylate kinase